MVSAVVLTGAGVACAFWMFHPTPVRHRWDLGDLAVYRAAGRAITHGHSVYGSYVGEAAPRAAAVHLSADRRLARGPVHVPRRDAREPLLDGNHHRVARRRRARVLRAAARSIRPAGADRARPGTGRDGRALAGRGAPAVRPGRDPADGVLRRRLHAPADRVGHAVCSSVSPPRSSSCPASSSRTSSSHGAGAPPPSRSGRSSGCRCSALRLHPQTLGGSGPTRCSSRRARRSSRTSRWKAFWNAQSAVRGGSCGSRRLRSSSRSACGEPSSRAWPATSYGVSRSPVSSACSCRRSRGSIISCGSSPRLRSSSGAATTSDGSRRRSSLPRCSSARLPYVGHDELHGKGVFATLLQDSYGLLCLGVLASLTGALPFARRLLARWATRTRAMPAAAHH